MIIKKYKRNRGYEVIMILVALYFAFDILREENFVLRYDEVLKIVFVFILLITGIWGLVTPLVSINDKKLKIRLSILCTKVFDLENIKVEFDNHKETILFSNEKVHYKLKLRNLKLTDKEKFKTDINNIITGK